MSAEFCEHFVKHEKKLTTQTTVPSALLELKVCHLASPRSRGSVRMYDISVGGAIVAVRKREIFGAETHDGV
jgi:hypothetical protein